MASNYIDLHELISLEGITYGRNYRQEEVEILQPQLEALGFKNITWFMGEADSFGPLTRCCRMEDQYGEEKLGIYG